MSIYNLEKERFVISVCLRFPEVFHELDLLLNENDFTNNLHATTWGVFRQIARSGNKIETVIVSEKINSLSLAFKDKVSSVFEYLSDLSLIQINSSAAVELAEQLKLVTLRRELAQTGLKIAESMGSTKETDPSKIMQISDNLYNGKMSLFDKSSILPVNICDDMEPFMLERAAHPEEEIGFRGIHQITHELYGSILRPSNISVIASRAGSGKTTFLNDFCFRSAEINGNPIILHLDNGEMSREEIIMRQCAALSGVPMNFIETGKYAKVPDMKVAVMDAFRRVKGKQFYYYNVGGKNVEDILSILRRFYLSKVGRGNKMIFAFDYLKSTSENDGKQEWETIGRMVDKTKAYISTECIVPMITACQLNRQGVVGGKDSANMQDDESVISGSDRIMFFSSQVFLLRKKTHDELSAENGKFGTHKLQNLKARHLGENVSRALSLVKLPDGKLRQNHINLDINNFSVNEKMDLKGQVDAFNKMHVKFERKSVDI